MASRSPVTLYSCFLDEPGSETQLQTGVTLYEMALAWSQTSIQDSLLTYIQLFIGEGGWEWDSCRNGGCYPSTKLLWTETSVNKQATAGTPQQWLSHLPSHLLSPWNRDTFVDLSPFQEFAQFNDLEYNWNRGHIFSVSAKRAKHWL